MVSVKGTRGNIVNIEIGGINETIQALRRAGKEIENSADLGVAKAGTFIKEEVKESIAGNRVETRSVDTGTFANSVEFYKTGTAEGKVTPGKNTYPNGISVEEVATLLEHGTSKITARNHFINTQSRNEVKVKEIIQKEIDSSLSRNIKVGIDVLKSVMKSI